MNKLEQHHIKYEEIHGEDEIVMLSRSEHRLIHRELRADGAKPIPVNVIQAAHQRSPERKKYYENYCRSKCGKRTIKNLREKCRRIHFSEPLGNYTGLYEEIRYNPDTGSVTYSSMFRAVKGRKLIMVDVN